MSKLKKRYSTNKALQFAHEFVEEITTTNDWQLVIYGGPDELDDMDVGILAALNLGENAADIRLYEDYALGDRATQRLNSKMFLTKSGSVPTGTPPTNQYSELIVTNPSHIKVFVKSTVDDEPTVLDVMLKTRG